MDRTQFGREIELSCGQVENPAAGRIVAFRKRVRLSGQKFANRFGLDARALQEREHGSRGPDRAVRVPLTVNDRDPEAVARAFGGKAAMEIAVIRLCL